VCLINFNKGEDDEGCLKFCNILKWSATVLFQDAIGSFEKFAVFSLNKSDIHDLDDTLLSDFNTCI
jgi:hypothetical protein